MTRIRLTVPESCLETAKLASQAMDADVAGYDAFEITDESGNYTYTVDVSDEYLTAFEIFKQYPEQLLQSIELDFGLRFQDLKPPSLEDCKGFCSSLIIEVL